MKAVPLTMNRPAEVLVPAFQLTSWPGKLVTCPLLVKLARIALPVRFMTVLLRVVEPEMVVLPVRAKAPAPRRMPPATVALLRVSIPEEISNAPPRRLKARQVEVVAV